MAHASVGCRARTFGWERLAAMDGRAAGFVPGPGRNFLTRCVGVPRLAGTGLAGTAHSVHDTRRWVCGPRACR